MVIYLSKEYERGDFNVLLFGTIFPITELAEAATVIIVN
jgi:hypothetical protein